MSTILIALLPIFTLIVLGWVIYQRQWVDAGFWRTAEKLTYYLFLPPLMVVSIARADPTGLDLPALIAAILGGPLALTLLVTLGGRWLTGCDGPALSSMIQGTMRFNTYVGLAAAKALYGTPGVAVFALCVAATVPLANIISVMGLLRFGHNPNQARPSLLKPILTNPLIIGSLTGIAVNLLGGLPLPLAAMCDILGAASLPIGLLCVGAGLQLAEFRRGPRPLLLTTLARLVMIPCAIAVLAAWLGLSGLPQQVAIMFGALPTAPAAYILARQMGGNDRLMAAIVTLQTLGAMVTMPAILILLT